MGVNRASVAIKFFSKMVSLKSSRPIVFCGPSGSGKSTLVTKMMKEFPEIFGFSISHTTRNSRPGEIDGVHYHFTTKPEMEEAVKAGKFIESAIFSGNMYGTSKTAIESVRDSGKVCVLDIDVQGVKQIKQTDLNPWLVFVQPPSLSELETRLRARKTENEESLSQRLKVAQEEITYGKTPGNFHIIITNDDVDGAYGKLKAFLTDNIFKQVPNGDIN